VIKYDEISLYENIMVKLCVIDVGILILDLICFCTICDWIWDNMWNKGISWRNSFGCNIVYILIYGFK